MPSIEQYEAANLRRTITFENNFHGTAATVRAKVGLYGYSVSKRAAQNAYKKLCGFQGCQCGHNLKGLREYPNGALWCAKGELQT